MKTHETILFDLIMKLNALLQSMKPPSFLMSGISVGVGSALAALQPDIAFHWGHFFLTLLGVIFLHAGTNVVNDYFDHKNRVDTPDVPGGFAMESRVLIAGLLTPKQVLFGGFVLFALSLPIGIYLTLAVGWPVLVIGVVGFLTGFFYTANPISFKYKALGELAVFLMWGPLMVSGAYYVQTQQFSWEAVLVSLPFGILVALVLLANNLRDIQYDGQVGIKTLSTLLGEKKALLLYYALAVLAYVVVILLVAGNQLTPWGLLVFLSGLLAWPLARAMSREIPKEADAKTAQLDMLFGLLLIASLILEKLLPLQ